MKIFTTLAMMLALISMPMGAVQAETTTELRREVVKGSDPTTVKTIGWCRIQQYATDIHYECNGKRKSKVVAVYDYALPEGTTEVSNFNYSGYNNVGAGVASLTHVIDLDARLVRTTVTVTKERSFHLNYITFDYTAPKQETP